MNPAPAPTSPPPTRRPQCWDVLTLTLPRCKKCGSMKFRTLRSERVDDDGRSTAWTVCRTCGRRLIVHWT